MDIGLLNVSSATSPPLPSPMGSAPSGPSAPGRSSGAAWRPRCGSRPGGGAGTRRAPSGAGSVGAAWMRHDALEMSGTIKYHLYLYIYTYTYTYIVTDKMIVIMIVIL